MNATAAPPSDRPLAVFGLLLLVDLILSVVMLATDKNLQTNFGAQSPYFVHWYGVLAMAVLDLVGGLLFLALAMPAAAAKVPRSVRRGLVTAGLVYTIVAILAMVGIVSSYSQVGFSSMSQFAQYLFGVTAYPGALAYIPGLYDALLVTYLVTAIVGVFAVMRARVSSASASGR